jgi:hypothetical protein
MQPFDWRQFATNLAQQPLIVLVVRLMLLVILLAGIALVYGGARLPRPRAQLSPPAVQPRGQARHRLRLPDPALPGPDDPTAAQG